MVVLVQGAGPGALDEDLEDIMAVIEAEVWGDIGEEKEAGAFSGGCMEAKREKGFDTYQLLAAGITFKTHVSALLQLVRPLFITSALCQEYLHVQHKRHTSQSPFSHHPAAVLQGCGR